MLKRVIISSRHHLEHSAEILACKLITRGLTSIQTRGGITGATGFQYVPVRQYVSGNKGLPVEKTRNSRESFTRGAPTPVTKPSPEILAKIFIYFLLDYGKTNKLALQHLNSQSYIFSVVRIILENLRYIRPVADYLAASRMPALCVRLLSLAAIYGHPPNAPTYESVCWILSQHKRYALVLEVCLLARASLPTPTGRLFGWWLRAACELERFASVGAILQECEDAGVKISRRHWHLVLTAHLRNRDILAARQCLSAMEDAGIPPDPTTHAVVAANYSHLGLDSQVRDLALSVLEHLPQSKATFVVNRLLATHLRFDDELGFHQLLTLFDDIAFQSLRTPSPLGDEKNFAKPLPSLRSPIPITPDVGTFLICIRFCVARSDLSSAERIFFLMGQRGFSLSSSILAVFLDLQFAFNRPSLAVHIAARLVSEQRLKESFNQLSSQKSDPRWVWPFPTEQIQPSIEIFNSLLRGLIKVDGIRTARVILRMMRLVRIEPNTYTIQILVNYILRAKRGSPAAALRRLRQLSPVFRPSLHHISPVLSDLLRREARRLYSLKGGITRVQAWATQHGRQDIDPGITKPMSGLRLEHALRQPRLLHPLLQSLESRGVRSDSAVLGVRIRYEGVVRRDVSAAVDTYNDMLALGMTPSAYHTAALMEAFCRRGETETAMKIMHSAKAKGNLVMYTILLQGYAHEGRPNNAVRLFQEMLSVGIDPDVRAIRTLCNAFLLAGQRGSARKFLLTLWTLVAPLPKRHGELTLYHLLRIFRALDKQRRGSEWNISEQKREKIYMTLGKVIKEYKLAAGLELELLESSPRIRQRAKESLRIDRKL